jgi:hypothetical protein
VALKDALMTDPEGLVSLVKQVIAEAEATSAEGLSPALTPNPTVTAQDVLGGPQGGGGAPPGPGGGGGPQAIPQGGIPANGSADDMTAGPAAQPGGSPVPQAPTE